jgi:hypothetical protein
LQASNIRLGVVQPEEHISTYNDALSKLTSDLTYMYSSADHRYWYDTRPTLKKTVAERAKLQNADDILFNIKKAIENVCKKDNGPFESVHIAPSSSGDVQDKPSIRLVLFLPSLTHKRDSEDSPAMEAAREYLEWRGDTPRAYKNMVVFLAPDDTIIAHLKQDMRMLMAWRLIDREADALNLDSGQKKETKDSIQQYEKNVSDRVQEAYQHLLVPTQHGTSPVVWEKLVVQGQRPISKAAQKLRMDDFITDAFSPKILVQEMAQNNLWKDADSLSIRELWENYTRYLYLYRLTGYTVLTEAIEAGVMSGDYFAYADGQDETGRYEGLCFGNTSYLHITQDGYLVKSEVAKRQIEKENADRMEAMRREHEASDTSVGGGFSDNDAATDANQPPTPTLIKKNTHFYGSVKIDANKLGTTAGTISTEVLQHLNKQKGAQVGITLDIHVVIPDGISDDDARTIRENCKTLKFDSSEFGEK